MVRRRLTRWRQRAENVQLGGEDNAALRKSFSPRQLVRWLLKPAPELSDAERATREHLEQQRFRVMSGRRVGAAVSGK